MNRVTVPAVVFAGCVLTVCLVGPPASSDVACWAADARPPERGGAAEREQAAEIARLVRELGGSTFMARQHAQRVLGAMGLKAKSALEAACDNPDPEIRQRAKQALDAIVEVDFHARLAAFLADHESDDGHGLAGWRRFRGLAGRSPAARRLFADMQRAERELLQAADEAPEEAGSLLDARCQRLEHAAATEPASPARPAHRSLGTMAAIVFVASDAGVAVSSNAGNCIYGFRGQASLNQALSSRPTAAVIRALLGAWVARSFDRDAVTSYINLLLAMQYNLKEAVAPALALIEPPGGPPHLQQYALLAIGKLGGREHVAALTPLLNDARGIGPPNRGNGRQPDAQLCEVALAVLLHLTDQKLSDYGFTHAKVNPSILFNANTLHFDDPAARAAALKKWRTWAQTSRDD